MGGHASPRPGANQGGRHGEGGGGKLGVGGPPRGLMVLPLTPLWQVVGFWLGDLRDTPGATAASGAARDVGCHVWGPEPWGLVGFPGTDLGADGPGTVKE